MNRSDSPKKKPKKLPQWITGHFEDSLESNETLIRILHLSEKGISLLSGMPKLVETLAEVDPQQRITPERIKAAKKEADLARSEIDGGFPVLHGFAVVALWSWLEHHVKGFVALWILNRKSALAAPPIQKIRIRLGEYMQLHKREQAEYLVDILEKELSSGLKSGVNRFESLLSPFELGGSVPEDCARNIFELQQVRNVIAHRNGRADRRFKTACPWVKCKVGAQLTVDIEMINRYASACTEYWIEMLFRLGEIYDVPIRTRVEGARTVTDNLKSGK